MGEGQGGGPGERELNVSSLGLKAETSLRGLEPELEGSELGGRLGK